MRRSVFVFVFLLVSSALSAGPVSVTSRVSGSRLDITMTNTSSDSQEIEFTMKNPSQFQWPLGWPYKDTLDRGRARNLTMRINNTNSYSADWIMKVRKKGTTRWTTYNSPPSGDTADTPPVQPSSDPTADAVESRNATLPGGSYALPYAHGKSYRMTNGPNQYGWHQNQNAYDWPMPVGQNVCAARGGTVVAVKSDSNRGGASEHYKNDANYVLIRHSDGTIANYLHFAHNTVAVRVGQKVAAGTLLGKSGQTGWATEPHLHFHVADANQRTLVVRFLTQSGVRTLSTGTSYTGFHPWRSQRLPTDCP